MTATTPEGSSSEQSAVQPPLQNATPVGSHHSNQRPSDTPAAVDSSLLLPMKEYLGCRVTAQFAEDGCITLTVGTPVEKTIVLSRDVMRQLIDFYILGQQVLILRKQSASGTEADQAEKPWQGVYPGMCINPEECKGRTSCPRKLSCCE